MIIIDTKEIIAHCEHAQNLWASEIRGRVISFHFTLNMKQAPCCWRAKAWAKKVVYLSISFELSNESALRRKGLKSDWCSKRQRNEICAYLILLVEVLCGDRGGQDGQEQQRPRHAGCCELWCTMLCSGSQRLSLYSSLLSFLLISYRHALESIVISSSSSLCSHPSWWDSIYPRALLVHLRRPLFSPKKCERLGNLGKIHPRWRAKICQRYIMGWQKVNGFLSEIFALSHMMIGIKEFFHLTPTP